MNTLLKQKKEFEEIFTERYGTSKPSFKSFYWQRPEKTWNWIEKAIKEAREEFNKNELHNKIHKEGSQKPYNKGVNAEKLLKLISKMGKLLK